MSEDQVLVDALGEDFTKIYEEIKYKECNDYMLQVSEWEIRNYLDRM